MHFEIFYYIITLVVKKLNSFFKSKKELNEKKSIKNKFGALNQGLKLSSGEIIGIFESNAG